MNRESKMSFPQMMVAIWDSLSDVVSSDDGEDVDDDYDEDTEHCQICEDDEPGWLQSTITNTVPQRIERFRQKQLHLDELTQPGWEDAAGYFCQRDEKYGTSEMQVPAVVKPHMDDDSSSPALTTFRELMECLDIVPGITQMLQQTSRQRSNHVRLGSGKPQPDMTIPGLAPATELHSSLIRNGKPVELVGFYPCI